MKKFKAISTSVLAFLMCGSMFVGCGGGGEKTSEKPADSSTKTEIFESVGGSLGEIFTGEGDKTYKVALDLDFTGSVMGTDSQMTSVGSTIDGSIYFNYELGENPVVNVDAIVDGEAKEGEEKSGMHAAAYLRTDTVAFGYLMKDSISEDDKKNLALTQMAMEDVVAMLEEMMGTMMPMNAEGDSAVGSGGVEQLLPYVMPLVEKIAKNVVAAAEATVSTKDGVTTLTYDVKAEINSIFNTVKTIVNSIGETTKISDLIANDAFKAFFNKYLGTVTAEDIKTVLDVALGGVAPAVTEGQSGYDYAVAVANAMFEQYLEMPIAEMKPMIEGMLTEVETTLNTLKKLYVSLSVKNDKFYGFATGMELDHAEAKINYNFAVTLEEVTYTFKPMSELVAA